MDDEREEDDGSRAGAGVTLDDVVDEDDGPVDDDEDDGSRTGVIRS